MGLENPDRQPRIGMEYHPQLTQPYASRLPTPQFAPVTVHSLAGRQCEENILPQFRRVYDTFMLYKGLQRTRYPDVGRRLWGHECVRVFRGDTPKTERVAKAPNRINSSVSFPGRGRKIYRSASPGVVPITCPPGSPRVVRSEESAKYTVTAMRWVHPG